MGGITTITSQAAFAFASIIIISTAPPY